MTKKMIIDATHEEETRVAVVEDGRLAEFEYESAFRKPLKGNIFLAKVTRVEPSLQAAFVNYGGNRHGFLPFSEIHPDYFRIPIADREALIAEQEAELREIDEAEEDEDSDSVEEVDEGEEVIEEVGGDADGNNDNGEDDDDNEDDANGNVLNDEDAPDDNIGNKADDSDNNDDDNKGNRRGRGGRGGRGRGRGGRGRGGRNAAHKSNRTETFGGEEIDDEQRFRFSLRRKYKIQEVIKRGQIMLVQVSKEERGNKGAAVSSYLSLPGRYCVLMPNSPRAGGVSRKISNHKERAKMRDMMKELEVPKGMSVILRTAGVTRTKAEVKRDLDYLMRLWNNIRELTLESSAPAMVYEEADLVKRSIRDLYTRDIEEIHVAGESGYKTAKEFMKMMIPSHAKRVIEYKDDRKTLFNKFKIEEQIADIGETTVNLKSGGYLIINPTEALVSIDVNSGKATKERHIEETALKTNLEAAEEVARQLRLRDLGGLVVIDFIDMEDRRNNGKVERKMRDSLSGDKARIQMGRISSFGLMEMSRQRMSASLGESQFETCKHCEGSGRTRTADAASILVLRDIETECIKGRAAEIMVHVSGDVAVYILNNKRQNLIDLEERYDVRVVIRVDDTLGASGCRVEVSKPKSKNNSGDQDDDQASHSDNDNNNRDNDDEGGRSRRRRGRRGGRRRNQRDNDEQQNDNSNDSKRSGSKSEDAKSDDKGEEKSDHSSDTKDEKPKRSRSSKPATKSNDKDEVKDKAQDGAKDETKAENDDKPKRGRGRPAKSKDSDAASEKVSEDKADDKKAEKPKRASSKKDDKKAEAKDEPEDKKAKAAAPKAAAEKKKPAAKKAAPSNDDKPEEPVAKEYEVVNEPPKKKKKGWWNKMVD